MQEKTCCFIGHRTIDATEALKRKLTETIEKLITEEKVAAKRILSVRFILSDSKAGCKYPQE